MSHSSKILLAATASATVISLFKKRTRLVAYFKDAYSACSETIETLKQERSNAAFSSPKYPFSKVRAARRKIEAVKREIEETRTEYRAHVKALKGYAEFEAAKKEYYASCTVECDLLDSAKSVLEGLEFAEIMFEAFERGEFSPRSVASYLEALMCSANEASEKTSSIAPELLPRISRSSQQPISGPTSQAPPHRNSPLPVDFTGQAFEKRAPIESLLNTPSVVSAGKCEIEGQSTSRVVISASLPASDHANEGPTRDRLKIAPTGCVFCTVEHRSEQCSQFRTLKQKYRRARVLAICFRCCMSGHNAGKCTSARACDRCGSHSHHESFCAEKARRLDSLNFAYERCSVTAYTDVSLVTTLYAPSAISLVAISHRARWFRDVDATLKVPIDGPAIESSEGIPEFEARLSSGQKCQGIVVASAYARLKPVCIPSAICVSKCAPVSNMLSLEIFEHPMKFRKRFENYWKYAFSKIAYLEKSVPVPVLLLCERGGHHEFILMVGSVTTHLEFYPFRAANAPTFSVHHLNVLNLIFRSDPYAENLERPSNVSTVKTEVTARPIVGARARKLTCGTKLEVSKHNDTHPLNLLDKLWNRHLETSDAFAAFRKLNSEVLILSWYRRKTSRLLKPSVVILVISDSFDLLP